MMSAVTDYQLEHVGFVSGHGGTSLIELLAVLISWVLLLTQLSCLRLHLINSTPGVLVEFVVIVVVEILLVTSLSDHIISVCACLLISVTLTIACAPLHSPFSTIHGDGDGSMSGSCDGSRATVSPHCRRPVELTMARGTVFLMTALCILAVDFPAFPRRMAKAETFGCGVMDLGVGAFAMLHGMSAPISLVGRFAARWRGDLRAAVMLAVLAGVRLACVKTIGYHEHVSEYGVHWNFFVTLALVRVLCAGWTVMSSRKAVTAALLLMLAQHALLVGVGLELWALNDGAPRDTLVTANREGLASSTGFVALYMAGAALRHYLPAVRVVPSDHSIRPRLSMLALSLTASMCVPWLSVSVLGGVSRRLANLSYILLVTSMMTSLVLAFACVHLLLQCVYGRRVDGQVFSSRLLHLASDHALLLFCAANVATGVLNLTLETIRQGTVSTVAILIGYMAALTALISAADERRSTNIAQYESPQ